MQKKKEKLGKTVGNNVKLQAKGMKMRKKESEKQKTDSK